MTRRIKVLHLITANLTGPYFRALSRFSDQSGFELVFASLAARGPLHVEMEGLGHRTVSFDCEARARWPSGAAKIRRWLAANEVDVLHAHLFEACLVGLAAARAAGTPVRIFTGHHSHEVPHHSNWKLWAGDRLAARLLANRVLVHCAQMSDLLIGSYGLPLRRVSVLPLPFDPADRVPTPGGRERVRGELGLGGKVVFGAVGRLYWMKDYATLFEAFSRAVGSVEEAALVVVGTGPDESHVKALARRFGVAHKVVFAGYRTDIADVLDSFDVLVHSAVTESYCQVVVEALSLGKPVVSTAVGIVPELVVSGKTGFTAPPRDPAALSMALESCLAARGRWPAMGEAGRSAVGRLRAPAVVAEQEALYRAWVGDA